MTTHPQIPNRAGTKYTNADRARIFNLRQNGLDGHKLSWRDIHKITGIPQGSLSYLAYGSAPQREQLRKAA